MSKFLFSSSNSVRLFLSVSCVISIFILYPILMVSGFERVRVNQNIILMRTRIFNCSNFQYWVCLTTRNCIVWSIIIERITNNSQPRSKMMERARVEWVRNHRNLRKRFKWTFFSSFLPRFAIYGSYRTGLFYIRFTSLCFFCYQNLFSPQFYEFFFSCFTLCCNFCFYYVHTASSTL